MTTLSPVDRDRAVTFLHSTARVLERRRYEFSFGDGSADAVARALDAYRNDDGGYGNALEPDGRGPGSQPITTLSAVHVLNEVGADLSGVLGYLGSIATDEGGLPFVHPNAADYPRAPWWQVPHAYEGDLLATANLVGAVWAGGVTSDPWLDRAAGFCWSRIEALTSTHPYEALGAIHFLDAAPDRDRAATAAAKLGELVRSSGLVDVGDDSAVLPEGYSAGELKRPHDYAPTPDSLALSWFTEAEHAADLDRLLTEQRDDGGWRVDWPAWTPVTEYEWAGIITLENLLLLRRFDRLP
ncbi:hypothetical protein [Actinokineospora bangkokensis]|uniref:Prenyltransferase n=1 Tax=Actinokineospora bangkokensis TaxID=1193682 RepID=A0A1Q9LS86_9PSEU|nr:hypothetical protein [Actinokineospora bangkokensis]OLR94878.1 hypothetical protein BJP25_09675 [Actinokineospora bangkokensis]